VWDRLYYVYVLASRSRVLYVVVTNDLERRLFEHKSKLVPGFTSKYDVDRLVSFETTPDVYSAIRREKQIKGWRRSKKVTLIQSANPDWEDLSSRWAETGEIPGLRPRNDKGRTSHNGMFPCFLAGRLALFPSSRLNAVTSFSRVSEGSTISST
jgi:putative endonuclease